MGYGYPAPDADKLASLLLAVGQDGVAAMGSFTVSYADQVVYEGVGGGVVGGRQTLSPNVVYNVFVLPVGPSHPPLIKI